MAEKWDLNEHEEDERFENNLRRIVNLIDDPQEGISSWHTMRINLAKEIFQFLGDKGFRPKGG